MGTQDLLRVNNLSIEFQMGGALRRVVESVSFNVARAEKFALVGESGSGKTQTALAMLRLNGDARVRGQIHLEGRELGTLSDAEMRGVRGRQVAMIFQEPMVALNPLFSVGAQISESVRRHLGLTRSAAHKRAIEWLDLTGIPEPQRRVDSYPHELSGGQRQRAMIAMALACEPALLIADEPTTALDVSIQRQIVDLLDQLHGQLGMSVLLITHDLNLVRSFADRVGVMREGRLVEVQATSALFAAPQNPYTRTLLDLRPRRHITPVTTDAPVWLRAERLNCRFETRAGWFKRQRFEVLRDVDLTIRRGETVGIVGESGSGKTTLGMTLLRLGPGVSSGTLYVDGAQIAGQRASTLRPLRRRMQVVFQDPYNALSPRMTIEQIIGEGLTLHRPDLTAAQRRQAILAMLAEVGLDGSALMRYPHEFSGGQRQRIAIARAAIVLVESAAPNPDQGGALLLLDEPTSALDVSVQQQVLELLTALQRKYGLSYLFITHDLTVIRAMAHRIIVMKEGQIIEHGETEALFQKPKHPYTQALLQAARVAA
jgi:microcin C transport system ATP-binding protein